MGNENACLLKFVIAIHRKNNLFFNIEGINFGFCFYKYF